MSERQLAEYIEQFLHERLEEVVELAGAHTSAMHALSQGHEDAHPVHERDDIVVQLSADLAALLRDMPEQRRAA